MNTTIKCWLIANLDGFAGFSFLTLIVTSNIVERVPPIAILQWIIIGLASIAAIYFAVRIAIYTYQNFDEVVSYRMLWGNSNVSMFNEQLKYAFNRFGIALLFFGTLIGNLFFILL